jgi:hypothetical protein
MAALSGTFGGEITGKPAGFIVKSVVAFTLVQSGNELVGTWTTSGGKSGTLTWFLGEKGTLELRARQVNPCEGDFTGVAAVETANILRGILFFGEDCDGPMVAASFTLTRR